MIKKGIYCTKSRGIEVELPLFIPVFRPDYSFELFSDENFKYGLNAVMVNSFLIYREKDLKVRFENGYTLRKHIGGFKGVLCTDSGAFQQMGGRKVDLDPVEIVKFQNNIKTDIAAPLDLITPPDVCYEESYRRMVLSQYRIEEAAELCDYSDLAGIQQGGGFYSLRQRHIRLLADIKLNYYGIGSMVPFFNKNHDLFFACMVINDARKVVGSEVPIHVYGAGDPLEIAFMFQAGASVFDSSSYAHYARCGYYMTPYGAVNKRASCERLEYACPCPICRKNDMNIIFCKESGEKLRQQHNLLVILDTIRRLRLYCERGNVEEYLSEVFDKHVSNMDLFPNSLLAKSWERFLRAESSASICEQHTPSLTYVVNSGDELSMKNFKTEMLSEMELSLLNFLAKESLSTYKMDLGTIFQLLTDELLLPQNVNFRAQINCTKSLRDVQRLNTYKSFRKNLRTCMYQRLRQYKNPEYDINQLTLDLIECNNTDVPTIVTKLLESHVSTRERLPYKDEFVSCVCQNIDSGKVIIDIGCGFNPLLFPIDFFDRISSYIAVDKDIESTEIVRIFSKKCNIRNLKAFTWNIRDGLFTLERMTGLNSYDFAILLKVIPVVKRADLTHRNEHLSIPVLGEFPATRMLATVSRESMTKFESIEKREIASLKQFVISYGFNVESEFSCGSEFGYYLSK